MSNRHMTVTVPSVSSSWEQLKEEATYALKSGLLPAAVNTPEKAISIAMMGRELGLPVMASLNGLYVVNGKVTLSGALMLRLIYERVPGAVVTITTTPEKAAQECTVEMSRPGQKPMSFRFTIQEAQKAGFLSKQPWQQHPSTMLRWSAIRTGARIVFADALAGCYMPDELGNGKEIEAHIEPDVAHKPEVTGIAEALTTALMEATKEEKPEEVPFEPLPFEVKSVSEVIGLKPDTLVPYGKYKGTKFADTPRYEWGTYAKHLETTLADNELPPERRGECEVLLEMVRDYLKLKG